MAFCYVNPAPMIALAYSMLFSAFDALGVAVLIDGDADPDLKTLARRSAVKILGLDLVQMKRTAQPSGATADVDEAQGTLRLLVITELASTEESALTHPSVVAAVHQVLGNKTLADDTVGETMELAEMTANKIDLDKQPTWQATGMSFAGPVQAYKLPDELSAILVQPAAT